MGEPTATLLAHIWSRLGGHAIPASAIVIEGPEHVLPGPLAATPVATAAVAAALLAAAELASARGLPRPAAGLDTRHVADAVRSERFVRLDGVGPGSLFDPLSAFAATSDGWIRVHANYPHHRAALLEVLGLAASEQPLDPDAVQWAFQQRAGSDLEDALARAGGVGAAMRSVEQWQAHPAGRALELLPLLDFWTSGGTADRSARRGASRAPVAGSTADGLVGHRPAAGLRVLDLTRVIAGPVGTRTLSALGAQVLRIDPPQFPELAAAHQDTGPGKRSALVDLRTPIGRSVLHDLLSSADVLVHGYRPGALEARGLDQSTIVRRYPQLVTVSLSAWGHGGPWGRRRGFDSIVQSASGIAAICGDDGRPGVLPAQLLDHATGHLAAAAALRGLTERLTTGRPGHARLALARTAGWLVAAPRVPPSARGGALDGEGSAYLVELDSPAGRITQVAPPGTLGGTPLTWSYGAHPWGTDLAVWGSETPSPTR